MKKYTRIAVIIGIILIIIFIAMPEYTMPSKSEPVAAGTSAQRLDYFASHGWEVEELFSKKVVIPEVWSAAYEQYAAMQDKQGLPLRDLRGRNAELYVYRVRNYREGMLAELLVCDGILAASMVYSEDQGSTQMAVQ